MDDDDAYLILCNRLKTFANVPVLLSWFVKNYVLCSAKGLVPYDAICSKNIDTQVRIVTDYQVKQMQDNLYRDRQLIETTLLNYLHWWRGIDSRWTQRHMEELTRYDACLRHYFVAMLSMNIAYNTSIYSLTEDRLEILWTLWNPCATIGDLDINKSMSGGLLSISKAIKLARWNTVGSTALKMLYRVQRDVQGISTPLLRIWT